MSSPSGRPTRRYITTLIMACLSTKIVMGGNVMMRILRAPTGRFLGRRSLVPVGAGEVGMWSGDPRGRPSSFHRQGRGRPPDNYPHLVKGGGSWGKERKEAKEERHTRGRS